MATIIDRLAVGEKVSPQDTFYPQEFIDQVGLIFQVCGGFMAQWAPLSSKFIR